MWWVRGRSRLHRAYKEIGDIIKAIELGLVECQERINNLEEEKEIVVKDIEAYRTSMEFGKKFLEQLHQLV